MAVEKLNITQLASSGFEDLPSQLYDAHMLTMVPNKISTAYFHSAFFIPGKGRVVIYDNPGLYLNGMKAMALGYFECANEPDVAQDLFSQVGYVAKQNGAGFLIGPMNGSTWDNYRFSLTHDSPNFFLEPYHHLYYNQLWQEAGFETIATYSSSMDRQMNLFQPDRLSSWQSMMNEIGVVVRPLNVEKYEEEIARVHGFCESTFAGNYLYTPIPQKEFIQKYMPLKKIIDKDFVLVAEDAEKNLVSVFFAIPDLYNKSVSTLIVKTIARNPERKYAGLMHLMANQIIDTAVKKGFKQMIHAFMHDDNKSNNVSGKFSGEVFRKYALYGKQIN